MMSFTNIIFVIDLILSLILIVWYSYISYLYNKKIKTIEELSLGEKLETTVSYTVKEDDHVNETEIKTLLCMRLVNELVEGITLIKESDRMTFEDTYSISVTIYKEDI